MSSSFAKRPNNSRADRAQGEGVRPNQGDHLKNAQSKLLPRRFKEHENGSMDSGNLSFLYYS